MRQRWEIVADALRQAMSDGTYQPGDQLPSEHQLAQQHSASRPTVRRALRELRLRGLIETRQGKGAFVRRPSLVSILLVAQDYHRHRHEGRPGFNAQVREQGHLPRQEITGVATVAAPADIAERLGVATGEAVTQRQVRFLVDDVPVQIASAYYKTSLAEGTKLARRSLITGGTHSELQRLGVAVTRLIEDFLGARLPTPGEERALRLPTGVPVVRHIRTSYAGDEAVEVLDTIAHGELVAYRFELEL